jgi:hypothetical protein
MAAPRRALIVATAAPTFRGSDTTAGCYAEELAAPYNAWAAAGFDIDIATPSGDAITWSARTRVARGERKTTCTMSGGRFLDAFWQQHQNFSDVWCGAAPNSLKGDAKTKAVDEFFANGAPLDRACLSSASGTLLMRFNLCAQRRPWPRPRSPWPCTTCVARDNAARAAAAR